MRHWIVLVHSDVRNYNKECEPPKRFLDWTCRSAWSDSEKNVWLVKVNQCDSEMLPHVDTAIWHDLLQPICWVLVFLTSPLTHILTQKRLSHCCSPISTAAGQNRDLLRKWKCGEPRSSPPRPLLASHSLLLFSHEEELSAGASLQQILLHWPYKGLWRDLAGLIPGDISHVS